MERSSKKGSSVIWKFFFIFQILSWGIAIFESFKYSNIFYKPLTVEELTINSIATLAMVLLIYFTASRAFNFSVTPILKNKSISLLLIASIISFISYQSWVPIFRHTTDQLQAELKSFYYIIFLFPSLFIILENLSPNIKERPTIIWAIITLFYFGFTNLLSFIFLPEFVQFSNPNINALCNSFFIISLCLLSLKIEKAGYIFLLFFIFSIMSQEIKLFLDFNRGGYALKDMIHIFIVYNSPFLFIILYFRKRTLQCHQHTN